MFFSSFVKAAIFGTTFIQLWVHKTANNTENPPLKMLVYFSTFEMLFFTFQLALEADSCPVPSWPVLTS